MTALNPYLLKAELLQREREVQQLRKTIAAQGSEIQALESRCATMRGQLNQCKQRPENELEFLIANYRLQIDHLQREKLDLKRVIAKNDANKQILLILANLNQQNFKANEQYIVESYTKQLRENAELERAVADLRKQLALQHGGGASAKQGNGKIRAECDSKHGRAAQHESEHSDKADKQPRDSCCGDEEGALCLAHTEQHGQNCGKASAAQFRQGQLEINAVSAVLAQFMQAHRLASFIEQMGPSSASFAPHERVRRLCAALVDMANRKEATEIAIQELEHEKSQLKNQNQLLSAELETEHLRAKQQIEQAARTIEGLERAIQRLRAECHGRANEAVGLQFQLEKLRLQLGA